jgi:DNA-binding NarL/FixJ family response regulator
MAGINVMLVDNNAARMESIVASLKRHDDLTIVSAVTTRESAIKQLGLKPHILLLNSEVLKQRTLSRFLRSVQGKSPATRVLLLMEDRPDDDALIGDIRLGVRGYVIANDSAALLAKAVRAVNEGEIWVERRVLEKALSRHMLLPETLRAQVPDLKPLTSREMDMLSWVVKGATNKEIASMSNISERTVKTHLYRVYRKLKVKSRTKAIALLSQT